MKSDETLLLQALKLKQLGSTGHSIDGDLVEQLTLQNPESAKETMRNICAFISTELFNEVEGVCSLLRLTKRQFVEMALVDLMEKAHNTLTSTKALEPFEA